MPSDCHGDSCGERVSDCPKIEADNAGQGEKRQVLPPSVTRETAREIIKKIKNSERPVINAGNGIRIGHAFDAVSYTHLDVYKRQFEHSKKQNLKIKSKGPVLDVI